MWTTILSILSGAFQAATKLLDYLGAQRLRQDGRNEQRLEDLEQRMHDVHTAQEIDRKPTPADKPSILSRL